MGETNKSSSQFIMRVRAQQTAHQTVKQNVLSGLESSHWKAWEPGGETGEGKLLQLPSE